MSEHRPPVVDPHRDAVAAHARRLATPVDVAALVAAGVLARRGPWWRRWYEVLDPRRLPPWALGQIAAMRDGPRGSVWVRFRRRNRAAERLAAELGASAGDADGAPPSAPPSRAD